MFVATLSDLSASLNPVNSLELNFNQSIVKLQKNKNLIVFRLTLQGRPISRELAAEFALEF